MGEKRASDDDSNARTKPYGTVRSEECARAAVLRNERGSFVRDVGGRRPALASSTRNRDSENFDDIGFKS